MQAHYICRNYAKCANENLALPNLMQWRQNVIMWKWGLGRGHTSV